MNFGAQLSGLCSWFCHSADFGELFDKSSDVVLYGKNGRSQILSNMTVGKIILKNNEFYLIVGDNTTLEQFLLIVDMDMKIKTSVEIRKTEMRNFFNRVLISRFHFLNDTLISYLVFLKEMLVLH